MILLTIASCFCLLFAFTACGGGQGDSTTAEKVNEVEVYKEVFAALGQCYLTGEDNELISVEEKDAFADDPGWYYVMKDFDGNGIKELIVGYGYDNTQYPTSIYSIKDNHPILLPTGYIHNIYDIDGEGVLKVSGDGEKTKDGTYKINGTELKKASYSEEAVEMVFDDQWSGIPRYELYAKAYTEGIDLKSAQKHIKSKSFPAVWIKRGDRFLPLTDVHFTSVLNKMNYLQEKNGEETSENLYWLWDGEEEYEQTMGENDELVLIGEGLYGENNFVKMEGSQGYTYGASNDEDIVEYMSGAFYVGNSSNDTIYGHSIKEMNGEPLDTSEIEEYLDSLIKNDRGKSEKTILSDIVSNKGTINSPNKYLKLGSASIYLGSDDKTDMFGFHEDDYPEIYFYYILDMEKGESIDFKYRDEDTGEVTTGLATANAKYLNFPDDINNYKPEKTALKAKTEDGYLVIDTSMLGSGEYVIEDYYYIFKKE